MPNSADAVRRGCGLLFLITAFAMLVWGQTGGRESLHGGPFLVYWSACFFLTFAAIVVALLDMRVTRRRAREEHDQLLRQALGSVGEEPGQSEKPDLRRAPRNPGLPE